MPGLIRAKTKHYVATEEGEALSVRTLASNKVLLDNGQRVQIKHASSAGTVIAQSQTDAELIAAPVTDGFYLVILAMKIMCDAATLVTLNSKGAGAGTAIDGPWPIGAAGGFIDPFGAAGLFRCVAGEALTMTTGAGGNTSYRIDYIEVPIDVDIL